MSKSLSRYPGVVWSLVLVLLAACSGAMPHRDVAQAIAVAKERIREHGQAGLSVNDVKRTRDWFTPELYDLLIRDMTLDVGGGYLNWDPFTAAQDDVDPLNFVDARQAGDTVLVNFARKGYGGSSDTITLAMRRVSDSWRIANFIYPAHPFCYRDLAAGMAVYAKKVAEHRADDKGSCTN